MNKLPINLTDLLRQRTVEECWSTQTIGRHDERD